MGKAYSFSSRHVVAPSRHGVRSALLHAGLLQSLSILRVGSEGGGEICRFAYLDPGSDPLCSRSRRVQIGCGGLRSGYMAIGVQGGEEGGGRKPRWVVSRVVRAVRAVVSGLWRVEVLPSPHLAPLLGESYS